MKALMLVISICAAIAVAGCGDDDSSDGQSATAAVPTSGDASNRTRPKAEVPDGAPPKELVETELIEGTGAEAKKGSEVTVQYVGLDFKKGEEFDASWDRGEPFTFQLGAGEVIAGWDQGIEGMKVGGRRELTIPPDLAYGSAGRPPAIAPNETLVFVVDLLGVK